MVVVPHVNPAGTKTATIALRWVTRTEIQSLCVLYMWFERTLKKMFIMVPIT